VPEVAQQPPEALGPAAVPVGDDKDAFADPGARRGLREPLGRGQRVSALPLDAQVGEIVVRVEERGARDVPLQVQLAAPAGVAELPAAVDEPVAQTPSLGEFGEMTLSRRAALLAPGPRPQSRSYLIDTNPPCVLASERASHPDDERHPAKPS
jgi:hypothetical protein